MKIVATSDRMAGGGFYDKFGMHFPQRNNMVFRIATGVQKSFTGGKQKTSVEIEMPVGSEETIGMRSDHSHVSTSTTRSNAKSHVNFDPTMGFNSKRQGADAWWSVGDFLQPGLAHRNKSRPLAKTNDDDSWDLSDSIVDLYKEVNKPDLSLSLQSPGHSKVDPQHWIEEDTSHGFVRVFKSDTDTKPRLFPCTLSTTAQKLCVQCAMPPNSLHVQFNGDIIRRLEPFDCPLALQNEYLQNIGYADSRKIQEIGSAEDLSYLVKFYAGKPLSDSTYSRNQLTTFAYVRKGKILYQWVRRLCVITGTRLLIYRDRTKSMKPTIVQLAKGAVEEMQNVKGHDFVLKLTSTLQGERSIYLSFHDEKEFSKWLRKTKKATAKLPTKADLSNCHMEFLPETVFINEDLEILNLRHNVLKERPIEEDIYTIGWLDDLPRFHSLRSLNLADNDLRFFPLAVCQMRSLTELNLASNKIEDVPPDISNLEYLQMLHLHNNHLSHLPEEMLSMRNLLVLVLAFNHFSTVPSVLLYSHESQLRVDSLIMAGNRLERLSPDILNRMHHIKKVDFRMNNLTLLPSEMAKFHLLELVTHLDVRDNVISDLDVRALKALEYLNCERNHIHSLQVSGGAIKTLLASYNDISVFSVSPKPEWLTTLDLSHNRLDSLPAWISDCFFLVQLNASHNHVSQLPDRIFKDAQRLRVLQMSHNVLGVLPADIGNCALEELSLEHNQLTSLPHDIFVKMTKLRYICLTNNQLASIPEPKHNVYQNKLQELYISANQLDDTVIPKIALFQRLKVLHIAHNQITEIHDKDMRKLENLQELNISGNMLRHLPRSVGRHSKLQALRSNANLLKELPDFRYSTNLKVLEVGSNRLIDVSVTNLMASNVNLLDISGNPEMQVDTTELRGIKSKKKVCMVDIKGQNRSLLDLRTVGFDDIDIPWQSGLSQTSGIRNKLSVAVINRPKFSEGREGLFAMFDGGRNDEVTRILANRIGDILMEELQHPITGQDYMKYTMLAAHRKLRSSGQKLGAAGAICHIRKPDESSRNYQLHVANVGDTEVVLCRRGEAVCLSKLFTIAKNKAEMERVCRSDGIITEDNKINGIAQSTRLLGSSYLFPHVIPDPHVSIVTIQPEDQLIIIANQGLWNCMSYQEAVDEIINIPDPVLAAKRLQDLAQGYHSQENIGVLVVRLLSSPAERNRLRCLLQDEFDAEQKLLAQLKIRDIEREEMRKRAELEESSEAVPMEPVKLKGGKKRKQVNTVFTDADGWKVNGDAELDGELDGVAVKPFPGEKHGRKGSVTNWEELLQRRLAVEVKNKELINAMRVGDDDQPLYSPDNWSTTTKLKGQVKERVVTLPPKKHAPQPPEPPQIPPPLQLHRRQIIPDYVQLSTESLEFKRELKHPLNVDRDAVIFHEMQLSRSRTRNTSTNSIDSTQSVPAIDSIKEVSKGHKISSHSIEVLIHGPPMNHGRTISLGGSYGLAKHDQENRRVSVVDSCPTDIPMSDRLRMLEEKGFLPKEPTLLLQNLPVEVEKKYLELERKESQIEIEILDDSVHEPDNSVDPEGLSIASSDSAGSAYGYKIPAYRGSFSSGSGCSDGEIMITGQEYRPSAENLVEGEDVTGAGFPDNTHGWNGDISASTEIMILGPDKSENPSGVYAMVKKVKQTKGDNRTATHEESVNIPVSVKFNGNVKNGKTLHDSGIASVTQPGVKQPAKSLPNQTSYAVSDINANSVKSLRDLIEYNRHHQQKVSYKLSPKVAPSPPPLPPPSDTRVTKTASQRSIIITYL